ncbi:hypothetical protein CF319_g7138 [Tilletia indica]|nr:hypothetical protein CF319_g7138 [Tilletia indica]
MLLNENDEEIRVLQVVSTKRRKPYTLLNVEYPRWTGLKTKLEQSFSCTPAQRLFLAAQAPTHGQSEGKGYRVKWTTRCSERATSAALCAEAAGLRAESGEVQSFELPLGRALRLSHQTRKSKVKSLKTNSGSALVNNARHPHLTAPRRAFSGPRDLQDLEDAPYDPDLESFKSGNISEAGSSDLDPSDDLSRRLDQARSRFDVETECVLGGCGGWRQIGCSFSTKEDGELVRSMLATQHGWRLDANVVRPLEEFSMPAGSLQYSCIHFNTSAPAKLMRVPWTRSPTAQESTSSSSGSEFQTSLPIPPKLAGLWMGDGDAMNPIIISADDETEEYMETCVDLFNGRRPEGTEPVRLVKKAVIRPGDYRPTINTYAKQTTYSLSIVASEGSHPRHAYTPFRSGLKELGMLKNKIHSPALRAGAFPKLPNSALSIQLCLSPFCYVWS